MSVAPSGSVDLSPGERDRAAPIGRDRLVATLAGEQWGIVAHQQLLALGYSGSAVHRAVQAGRLHRRHVGVYSVGHTALTREGRWLGAVLASGPETFLSHRAAGVMLELRPTARLEIEVTSTHRGRISPPGIVIHGTARLGTHEVTVRSGIPVTTVSRTLADLASVLGLRDLERTFERAQALQVLDVPSVLASVANRPGAPAVRRILGAWETLSTRSELEIALLSLIRSRGLPVPIVNARVGAFEVDLLWPAALLVAEADSIAFHRTTAAMERDRRRDAVLARDGYRVLRFTHRQVHHRPHEVVDAIRAALR